jgi:AraC-like DNA-binding protein
MNLYTANSPANSAGTAAFADESGSLTTSESIICYHERMGSDIPTYRNGSIAYQPDPNHKIATGVKTGHVQLFCLTHNQYLGTKLPTKVLPGLNTIGYWDADHEQQWGTDWHFNEGLELVLIENGQVTFALDGREYRLHPGDFTLTKPWLRHRLGDPHVGPSRIYWMMLDVGVRRPNQVWRWPSWIVLTPGDRKTLARLIDKFEHHVWRSNANLRRCFYRIGEAIRSQRHGNNLSLIGSLVNEALFLLLQELKTHHEISLDESNASLETVNIFWNKLKSSPDQLGLTWTLNKMARHCQLGVTQFVYYTKKLFNLTPMHYLNRCRLENAARLLQQQPQRSVTDIAFDCGFSTPQYFTKAFHKYYGFPPKIFRCKA